MLRCSSAVSILKFLIGFNLWLPKGGFQAVSGDQSDAELRAIMLYWLEWKKCKLVRIPLNTDEVFICNCIKDGVERRLSERSAAAISHKRSRYSEAKVLNLNRQSRSRKFVQGKSQRRWKKFTDQLSILKIVKHCSCFSESPNSKRKEENEILRSGAIALIYKIRPAIEHSRLRYVIHYDVTFVTSYTNINNP